MQSTLGVGLDAVPGENLIAGEARLPMPDTVQRGEIAWPYALTIAFVHLIALAALVPWCFSWTGVVVVLVGVHVFG